MAYFKNFQKVDYDLRGNGYYQEMTNLSHFARITSKYLDDISLYEYVHVQDGERPDNLSMRLYGTPDYYWTFMLINQHIVNIYEDWPKSNDELKSLA